MTPERVLEVLQRVAAGRMSPAEALRSLAWLPVDPLHDARDAAREAFARLDHHRELRLGFPEAVYCRGKTLDQVVAICGRLADRTGRFLATRADETVQAKLAHEFPDAFVDDIARIVLLGDIEPPEPGRQMVLVVTAGTADLPVAEEAALTARAFGNPVEKLYDVGVAGLHRLLHKPDMLSRAGIIIVVAGMDGALPSVLGGLVACPVIAVPTSTGYGASFEGLAPLLAMLNSCASGITVTNIDNGFGAACAATRINRVLAAAARAGG